MSEPTLRAARFAELTAAELYALLRLRVDVFVVEQECPYPELDGLDTEPTTEFFWVEADGQPVTTLRTFVDQDGVAHLGRVATHSDHRCQGYAATLVRAALDALGDQRVQIGAQSHLGAWYEQFGFRRAGSDYLEDGIPHLPMVREGGAAAGA